jgi:hypothetical protein
MEAPKCVVCAMPKIEWTGNNGEGVTINGESYCCQGCADRSGCTCLEQKNRTERILSRRDGISDPSHMAF